jgi:hypothetical protein
MTGTPMVETVSCLDGEGKPVPDDLRWGVYVVFKASSDYVAGCFRTTASPPTPPASTPPSGAPTT